MKHTLPELDYEYTSLEPYIDAKTMEIHHSKHHQGYVDKLNQALENHPDLENKSLEELLKSLDEIPEDIRTAVRNNAGGHYNHSLFWEIMSPQVGGEREPDGDLKEAIDDAFGSFEEFKKAFKESALSRFGSGWVWLVESNRKLEIISTPNQDNPISEGKNPLLGLDVWEHAYYLKYQNKRTDYIDAWWGVVNWSKVEERYKEFV